VKARAAEYFQQEASDNDAGSEDQGSDEALLTDIRLNFR